jgi:hypothetical protein
MVSLARLAFAHSNLIAPVGGVGDAASGVRVGSNWRGVCIMDVAGAEGVSAFAVCSVICAATVCATAVWMVVSCIFFAPQAVRSMDDMTMEVKSIYFMVLNIFFLS